MAGRFDMLFGAKALIPIAQVDYGTWIPSRDLTPQFLAREACRLLKEAGKPPFVELRLLETTRNLGDWARAWEGDEKNPPASRFRVIRLSAEAYRRLSTGTIDNATTELRSLLGLRLPRPGGPRCDYCGLKARETDQRCDGCGAPR
jgi:hypothetical protein